MWQLSEGERTNLIPVLKEEGNELFRKGQHTEASLKYSEALGLLEQMMLREKPAEDEWNALNSQKLPLLLNFAQCKLSQGEFYSVIEHCSTVLTSEPGIKWQQNLTLVLILKVSFVCRKRESTLQKGKGARRSLESQRCETWSAKSSRVATQLGPVNCDRNAQNWWRGEKERCRGQSQTCWKNVLN